MTETRSTTVSVPRAFPCERTILMLQFPAPFPSDGTPGEKYPMDQVNMAAGQVTAEYGESRSMQQILQLLGRCIHNERQRRFSRKKGLLALAACTGLRWNCWNAARRSAGWIRCWPSLSILASRFRSCCED